MLFIAVTLAQVMHATSHLDALRTMYTCACPVLLVHTRKHDTNSLQVAVLSVPSYRFVDFQTTPAQKTSKESWCGVKVERRVVEGLNHPWPRAVMTKSVLTRPAPL